MDKIIEKLPAHLRKYVVDQNYDKYTPEDQAVWRYIMLRLRSFLSQHAHPCYTEGLEKTGITTDKIPRIEDINKKLSQFGWGAVPVSGFIPPAAFMEFQSLGVLPIASDMRSIDHILYTPAPDIVHEAAGHAPILIDEKFANYLKRYADIARKAIISKQDMDQYEAIRILSDIKENPQSTPDQITDAEKHLEDVTAAIRETSEAGWLSRMNWWTAEYGLIGNIENPQIFGAGLLSSIGESRDCLGDHVKKVPLTVDCVSQSYDITEPQPQLFVTPDFENLHLVLDQLANQLSFKKGGVYGLEKARAAETVNTLELNSGLQISGVLERFDVDEQGEPIFFKMSGPSQISIAEKQLKGHGPDYHSHGYSSPIGPFNQWDGNLAALDLEALGIQLGKKVELQFVSGIVVQGLVSHIEDIHGRPVLIQFEQCTVKKGEETLFAPDWGLFDMAVGTKIPSVFGGAADRERYEGGEDFVAATVPPRLFGEEDQASFELFSELREFRESLNKDKDILQKLTEKWSHSHSKNWLVGLEIVELSRDMGNVSETTDIVEKHVRSLPDKEALQHFSEGLKLLGSDRLT